MADNKSEKDILAENTRLTGELAIMRTSVEAANARSSTLEISNARITGERDEARAALHTANQTVATRDASIVTLTKERDDLKANQSNLDAKVAAEVAKAGISPRAFTQPKTGDALVPGVNTSHVAAPGADGKRNYTAECMEQAQAGRVKPLATEAPAPAKV